MNLVATRSLLVGCALILSASSVLAQRVHTTARTTAMPLPPKTQLVPAASAPTLIVQPSAERTAEVVATSPVLQRKQTPKVVDLPQSVLPGVKIGSTFYDFQTNSSMARRIAVSRDGADKYLQVLWMAATDGTRDVASRTPGFNETRGSYYNFLEASNGTELTVGLPEWTKMEIGRAGWPSIALFEDGSVGNTSHVPIRFFRNSGIGDDAFFQFSEIASASDNATWPRVAIDGRDNVHAIYNRTMPDQSDQLIYRRSTNGGESWEPEVFFTGPNAVVPPSLAGQTLPGAAGGDTYAIAARGPVVAVAYSDGPLRTLVRKSTDYGATWNDEQIGLRLIINRDQTFIDSTITGTTISLVSDTTVSPSTMHAIAIDSDGRVHLATSQGLMYVLSSGSADWNLADRRGTIYSVTDDGLYQGLGMYYWPEGDTLIYTVGTMGDDRWDGEGKVVSRRAYTGVSRYPTIGFDEQDNVFMLFTGVKTGDYFEMQIDTTPRFTGETLDTMITVNGLYGHQYLTWRYKNNPTWSQPFNLTPDGVNCLFGSIAEEVSDGLFYMAYSASPLPGDRVTSVETEIAAADVMVAAVDVAAVGSPSRVAEERMLNAAVSIYPNPASDVARVSITSQGAGPISVRLFSVQGEALVNTVSPAGSSDWVLELPTQKLASGMYLLTIEQDGASLTRTVSVIH
ncbi:MAG: T9SS type A sorting domain-containing protein [Candidatus Kapaibacteriota bacterium]